jgi:hypothetical protein
MNLVWEFGHLDFRFVSDFDIRISNFEVWLGLHDFFLPLLHVLRHISCIDDKGGALHDP